MTVPTDFNPRPPQIVCACCTKPDDNMHLLAVPDGDDQQSHPCCLPCWETFQGLESYTLVEMPSPEPDHIVTLWSTP